MLMPKLCHHPILAFLTMVLISILLHSCTQPEKETRKQAQMLVEELQSKLKGRLSTTIKSKGVTEGIIVCSTEASAMTEDLSEQHGIVIKRVSHKLRNKANKLSVIDTPGISYFQMLESKGILSDAEFFEQHVTVGNQNYAHYMSPILTKPACLMCHGETIAEPIATTLSTLYPDDQATGFKEGQLRGAFSVLIPLNEN